MHSASTSSGGYNNSSYGFIKAEESRSCLSRDERRRDKKSSEYDNEVVAVGTSGDTGLKLTGANPMFGMTIHTGPPKGNQCKS